MHWICNHDHFRQRFRSPQAYPWNFCIRSHLSNKAPFPVPPLNVIMREFRGAFALFLRKLAGPPLYYVTFKRGLTGRKRNLPREPKHPGFNRARKKGEFFPYTYSFSNCFKLFKVPPHLGIIWKPLQPEPKKKCWVAKPLALKGELGCKTLSHNRNVGLQHPKPSLKSRWSLVCQV